MQSYSSPVPAFDIHLPAASPHPAPDPVTSASAPPPPPAPPAKLEEAAGEPAAKPRRHVQFNPEVASQHVLVPVVSNDREGDDIAERAIATMHAGGRRGSTASAMTDKSDDPFDNRYRVDDVPISLLPGENSGALQGFVSPFANRLEVWIDPLERDGLPSLPAVDQDKEKAVREENERRKAQGLVQGTTGGFGLWEGLRQRRKSVIQMKEKDMADEQKEAPEETAQPESPGLTGLGGPGILSALMALSQQEAAFGSLSTSSTPSSSVAPTPATSTPSSPRLGSSDPNFEVDEDSSDDDVEERERFIARLQKRRASKNALHGASSTVASASRSAATAAFRAATGGHFRQGHERGRSFGASSRSASTSTLSALHEEHPSRSPTSPISPTASSRPVSPSRRSSGSSSPINPTSSSRLSNHQRSHSSNTLSRLVSSTSLSRLSAGSASPPVSPIEPGMHVPHKPKITAELSKRVRKLGDRLGLELETEKTRPSAARSGAGVFGGLVMGAASLAAPATPAGSGLAPLPTRPGYHLSRYSAPDTRNASASPPPKQPGLPQTSPSTTPRASSQGLFHPRSPGYGSFDHNSRVSSGRKSLSDMPSAADEVQSATTPDSPRPALSISTSNLGKQRQTPSPVAANFRFFGPRTPGASSPKREYCGSTLAPASAAEREEDRWERKVREEAEREARERKADLKEWKKEKQRRKKHKLKELKARRVFITAHVAAILERQDFLLKLARAFMMFGAPSHRLEAQIQATARVLELPHCNALYLPNCLLVNFGDPHTMTSDIKFLKQPSGLDFGKLKQTYWVYNRVIRDKMGVKEASQQLDELMTSPPLYKLWQHVVIGGLAGAFIMPSAFHGSFIDCVIAVPLGGLLVLVQVFLARNDLYSSLFEIVVCVVNSIIAGALSYTNQFCYYSIAAGSIVLILPGFIVLCAALEIANRGIVSGAVRITYAALYTLLLGFGLSAGAEVYTLGGREKLAGGGDYTCSYLREGAPWWRQPIPAWWYFLTIPGFLICMAVKNGQPVYRRDTIAMVLIGCAGFSSNYFSAYAFTDLPALTSSLGAFAVGILGGAWSRATRESAFVVMIVGLFVQLPSGLANGGLLSFAQTSTRRTSSNFSSAVNAAAGLIRTTVGVTVGLFAAAALMNIVSRRGRRRGAHLSTF
ncbi:hypothetical protein JCM11641_003968 [Rhodosporidiobolus odoratus]